MNNKIELINVSKSFKDNNIVNNVSITFEEGTVYGIIGRNGSGKTVLFKLIAGLLLSTSGVIKVNGKTIGKDIDFPENLGLIIETPGFISYQSAYQNLKSIADIQNKIGKNEIIEVIEKVGLDPKDKKHVGHYSLGMRQKLGIAQAIMENPDILILDEPMNGLDDKSVENIRNILLELKNKGCIIILASHNKDDIDVLCDKVYRMNEGVLTNER